jgi:hypothetical protein
MRYILALVFIIYSNAAFAFEFEVRTTNSGEKIVCQKKKMSLYSFDRCKTLYSSKEDVLDPICATMYGVGDDGHWCSDNVYNREFASALQRALREAYSEQRTLVYEKAELKQVFYTREAALLEQLKDSKKKQIKNQSILFGLVGLSLLLVLVCLHYEISRERRELTRR